MGAFLMKSCQHDHHISRSDYLRFGTLDYFRNCAHYEIGDRSEAELSTRLIVDTHTKYPAQALQRLWKGAIAFGNGNQALGLTRDFGFQINYIDSGPIRNGSVTFKKCDALYQTQGSDAYIFCMTRVEAANCPPLLGYPDQWKMPLSKVKKFAQIAESYFNESFRLNPTPFIPEGESKALYDGAAFKVAYGDIKYRNRFIELRNPSVKAVCDFARDIVNSDLIKPIDYSHQREFRYCLRLIKNCRILPLNRNKDYMDLPADLFRTTALI
ncbi:hypothetical protein SAMN04488103_106122 [Gemmobacter aquatilis]|uniref:Uncharacterized protein n=1 Tax=Gemmobacter aquatilis TaxID=933059 RepID=A0A1H8I5G9_9RHOB|nr:hypothetical protein SAMN04488103_106122 [Gemmobacter aquatilis]